MLWLLFLLPGVLMTEENSCTLLNNIMCPINIYNTISVIPRVDAVEDCQTLCTQEADCSYFTMFTLPHSTVSSCALLRTCNTNDTVSCSPVSDTVIPPCDHAVSGPRSPPVSDVCCSQLRNKVCDGYILSQHLHTQSPGECQELCAHTEGCNFFTQYSQDFCLLYNSCDKTEFCTLCTSGPATPVLESCSQPQSYATLLIGGNDGKGYSTSIELITDSVTCSPDMPEPPRPLYDAAATLLGSTILYCGGHSDTIPLYRPDCHTYTLGVGGAAWKVGPSMNHPRYEFTMETYDGQAYAVGGNSDLGVSDTGFTVEVLSPGKGWSVSTEMRMPNYRFGHCSVVLKNKLIVVGGQYARASYSNSVIEFDLNGGTAWKDLHSTTYGRQYHACQVGTFMGQTGVFVTGGSNRGHHLVEFYIESIDRWRNLPRLNIARYHHTTSLIGGQVFVHGGDPKASRAAQESLNDTWTNDVNLREPRYQHASISIPEMKMKCQP